MRALMATVALGVGVGLAEVTVRWLEPVADSEGAFVPHHASGYRFQPDFEGFAGGVAYRTNALGYRGPDPLEPGNEPKRTILLLGDSYAFGYGVAYEESMGPHLAAALNEGSAPGTPEAMVVNLALPGYNTAQQLGTLRDLGPAIDPDLVLLAYHLNDIQRHPEESDTGAASGPGLRERFHVLRFVLPRLAALARAVGVPLRTTATAEVQTYVDGDAAWKQNQEALGALIAWCRERDVPVAALILPYMVQLDDAHPAIPAYDAAADFFRSRTVPVSNAFDDFRGRRAGSFWIHPFDGHPNGEAHEILAGAAARLIRSHHLLEDR